MSDWKKKGWGWDSSVGWVGTDDQRCVTLLCMGYKVPSNWKGSRPNESRGEKLMKEVFKGWGSWGSGFVGQVGTIPCIR